MSQIVLRELVRGDLYRATPALLNEEWLTGLTAFIDDKIIGFSGVIRYQKHFWVFFNTFDARSRQPFFLHRLVREVLRAFDRSGIAPIYSCIGAKGIDQSRAERWNRLLGFRPLDDHEKDDEICYAEATNGRPAWVRVRFGGDDAQ